MTAQAIIDRVKLNSADVGGDGQPQWIKLVPAGIFVGRDKRGPYKNIDADKVIAATLADDLEAGLPIDYNHATFKPGDGGEAPAAGWIKELSNRNGEIWGRVEWNDVGRSAIADKHYRYISPAFMYSPDGTVKKLLNAGLTNNPNLYFTAICSREETTHMAEKAKEEKQKLALHSAVDEAHKIIKKASKESGVPHHAFLSAMADKATADDTGDGDTESPEVETPEGTAAETRDDKALDAGAGDGDMDLAKEMQTLQAMESDLCGDDEGDDDDMSDEDDAEAEFSRRATAASQYAEKAGQADMAANFMSMARASRQRMEVRKQSDSPEQLEQMSAQAKKDGKLVEARALKNLATMRRNMSTKETKVVGLTAEQVRAIATEESVKHSKASQDILDAMLARQNKEAATAFVERSIREKRLTPAERDLYISLHVKDAKTCEEIVAKRTPVDLSSVETFSREVTVGDKTALMSNAESTICTMLGVKAEDFIKSKSSPVGILGVGIRQ